MKIHIHITKKRFYFLAVLLGLIVLITGAIAFNSNNPSVFGHTASEIDFNQGISSSLRILGNGNGIIFPDNTKQSSASTPLESLECRTYGYGTAEDKGKCPESNMLSLGHIAELTNGLTCDRVISRNSANNVHLCNICCKPS